jgi:hypothetical protein
MSNKNQINQLTKPDGYEQPAAFVIVPIGGGMAHTFLVYKWGMLDGKWFFDTLLNLHVELHPDQTFILEVPPRGKTMDLEASVQELKRESSLVVN